MVFVSETHNKPSTQRRHAKPVSSPSLPPARRKKKKRRSQAAPTVPVKLLVGWGVCITIVAVVIAAGVHYLPTVVDNVSEQIDDAHRTEFHDYSVQVPSGFESARDEASDIQFEGKRIGTSHHIAYKGPVFLFLSLYVWDPSQQISDNDVRTLLTTGDSLTAMQCVQHIDGPAVSYSFSNEHQATFNGILFAVADFKGKVADLHAQGRTYTYRDGPRQFDISAMLRKGGTDSDLDVLDQICSTIKHSGSLP